MTDPDPPPARAAATDPAEPVTVADIAAFTARLARLRPPALGGDPAEYAALLAHKAKLLARIADQHARTDPPHAGEAREIAERAQRAVTTRHAADAHDTTNVKDLRSPSFPGWGISLSNTGEFRRASSACRLTLDRLFDGLGVGACDGLADVVAGCPVLVGDTGWASGSGSAGFRRAGRESDLRSEAAKSAADPGRGLAPRWAGPFPGAAQVLGQLTRQP
jgi:hypothetical protein